MKDELKELILSLGRDFIHLQYQHTFQNFSVKGIFKTGKITQTVEYFYDKDPIKAVKKFKEALEEHKKLPKIKKFYEGR